MTNTVTIIERTVHAGEDRFLVLVNGTVFTSHPTRRGAEKIGARILAGESFE